MNIVPGLGIGEFRFGIKENELVQRLGEPDKVNDMELLNHKVYFYNEQMMQFSFDMEWECRLHSMTIAYPVVCLWNVNIMGKSKHEIQELLEKHGNKVAQVEDYDFFEVLICEKLGIEFHFEFDRLQEVECRVWIDEEDNVLWANENVLVQEMIAENLYESESQEEKYGNEFSIQPEDCERIADMSIVLGIGCGSVFFGEMISDVVHKLGIPDKRGDEEREGHIVYDYNYLMAKFYFCNDYDDRLLAIEMFHPDICLWGKKVIGMERSELENLLGEQNIKSRCYEDYDFFEVIFCEEIWMIFRFDYNKLRSIEFSIVRDKEGQLVWPKMEDWGFV